MNPKSLMETNVFTGEDDFNQFLNEMDENEDAIKEMDDFTTWNALSLVLGPEGYMSYLLGCAYSSMVDHMPEAASKYLKMADRFIDTHRNSIRDMDVIRLFNAMDSTFNSLL